jgi:hypothetical protein
MEDLPIPYIFLAVDYYVLGTHHINIPSTFAC